MNNFSQRVFSTLFAVPLAVVAICWSVWSYFAFFLLLTVLAMLEFYKLVALSGAMPDRLWGVLSGVVLYALVFAQALGLSTMTVLYWLAPMLALIFTRALYRKRSAPFTDVAHTLLGVCYVGGPLAMLHLVAFAQGQYDYQMVLGIMLLLWANDVGAYLVGKSIGKHRLFARISPKKSWEGCVGGGVLTMVVGYWLGHCWHSAHWGLWLGMGAIVVVAGPYGDLVESMLKRSVHVKDSGTLMPGHGGILDRIDSFLLAMPFLVAFVRLWG